jgi:hypothetical protein
LKEKIEVVEKQIVVISRKIELCDTAAQCKHCTTTQRKLESELDDLVFPK